MSRDVNWMGWHERWTIEDNLPLPNEVTKIEKDTVFLEESTSVTTIPYLETDNFLEDIAVQLPNTKATENVCIYPAVRRQLDGTVLILQRSPRVNVKNNVADHTRSCVKFRSFVTLSLYMPHCSINVTLDENTTKNYDNNEDNSEYIFNAMLELDPGPGVPETYKALMKTKDLTWIASFDKGLDNFLEADPCLFVLLDLGGQ